jgi:DNA-binding NtrC family response regulator
MRSLRIVVVDDDPSICAFLQAAFTADGHQCETFLDANGAEAYLRDHPADLALLDVFLGRDNGIDLISRFHRLHPDLHAVVMTAQVDLKSAARSVADGAVDYISKPIEIAHLRELCSRTVESRARDKAESDIPQAPTAAVSIIGRSPRMLQIFKDIGRVAMSNANVLITGASGTGKELVARAIHDHSGRKDKPFVAVNCGSFTETILETELFGHEKGAFTGADRAHRGLVESSDGGTLFLDEVTETSLSFQVKLLRVIQEQQVRRVGSNSDTSVDVRVLAASNRDVSELIKRGLFRQDLFYRLSVVQITLPSMEERREDIPLLVENFLQQFRAKNGRRVTIEPAAVELLQARTWPGNVRELENTVYRLAIFARDGRIARLDVDAESRKNAMTGEDNAARSNPDRLLELEKQHIVQMLKLTRGNKSEAARRLGIERKTLYKKALRLGINLQAVE